MKKTAMNPYLPLDAYIPDAEPRVFGDRLYIYGSHDLAGGEKGYCAGDYMVWSAPLDDLGNWRCDGVSYRRTDAPDFHGEMDALSAPDVVQGPDGRYYLYYNTRYNLSCAVAVSDRPEGPFTFYGLVHTPDGEPYREVKMFDPGVLIDEGQVYLYTGFSPSLHFQGVLGNLATHSLVCELCPDMVTMKELPRPLIPGHFAAIGTEFEGHGFYEASSPRKIGDKYVLVYSSELSHELCYAVSDYPDRDYHYMGILVSNADFGLDGNEIPVVPYGNNHGGLAQLNGDWYIFYHRHTHAIECCRQGCAEKLPVREDGWFGQAGITSYGLNGAPLEAEGEINAAYCCYLTSPAIRNAILSPRENARDREPHIYEEIGPDGGYIHYIADISRGTAAGYNSFSFAGEYTVRLKMRGNGKGCVSLHLDAKENLPAAETLWDGSNDWTDVELVLKADGVHKLYIVFDVDAAVDFQSLGFEKKREKETAMEIYKDASRPIPERVEDLLSRMTLEEKAAQLCGDLPVSFMEDGKVNLDALREQFPDGHGRFTQYSLVGIADPAVIAQVTNEVQRYFVEETRLGIPVALQTENLCGYPAAGGTIFPSMINMASTWEPELMEKVADIIGEESKAVGTNSAMSPVIDVSRDPRWGRTYETFGEDPYLISQMGVHYIRGMQRHGIGCIAKHFLGYAETQAGLNCAAERIGDRELYETFATPFEAADKEANVSGMMASYSEFDGIPVAANKKIARTLLRDTMGFKGMLISDGGGVARLYSTNKVVRSYEEAGLYAKKGGCDTEIPVGGAFKQLPKFVREGKLDESLLDESVRRILAIKFNCGLFEHPYVDVEKVAEAMTNASKQELSEKAAEKSLTLLKNDGILPLKGKPTLAVIGPHADSLRYPISGYTYPAYLEMIDASRNTEQSGDISIGGMKDESAKEDAEAPGYAVQKKPKKTGGAFASMVDLFNDEQKKQICDMTTALRAIGTTSLKEELEKRYDVRYAMGCEIKASGQEGFAEAVKAAAESDIVVMALGGNCGWVNVTGGEGKDRCHLDLPGEQQALLEAVAATGKPVVLVLYGPGCFAIPWADEHCAAIVQAWMPGPYAGKAVARLLDGTVNPGGKLPVTFPRTIGQVPIFYNHKVGSGYQDTYGSNLIFSGGYVDGSSKPLYPFGFGLSYTSFALTDFAVESNSVPTEGGTIRVSVTVCNTGDQAGDETVQLYTHFKDAYVTRPWKQLVAFQRISLKPGQQKRVTFAVSTAQLGYYNEDMVFGVEPGAMDVMVGTSSADIAFTEEIHLTGEAVNLMGRRSYTSQAAMN